MYRSPLTQEQILQTEFYYLDSMFGDALTTLTKETYETLDEAILKHDKEFDPPETLADL